MYEKISSAAVDSLGLSDKQKRSVGAIANSFFLYGDGDEKKLAYIIATAKHESNLTPIKEIKGKSDSALWAIQKKYWDTGYFGRGFVQITWKQNYEKLGNVLGVDLVGNPDLALRLDVAADIIVIGMMKGLFTGKKLSDYINANKVDFHSARKTVGAINVLGLDTAKRIEDYANKILSASGSPVSSVSVDSSKVVVKVVVIAAIVYLLKSLL